LTKQTPAVWEYPGSKVTGDKMTDNGSILGRVKIFFAISSGQFWAL
jgi:hypothetical protein